jgi:poly-gamma-glutamate capsule biosynthesis protein CapA/YwtB (metallophosphatase superfamily)
MLTGDVMLGRGIDQILRHSVDPVLYESHVRSAETYVAIAEDESGAIPREAPPAYVWGDALALLQDHQPAMRIINLETAITTADQPWPGKGIHYRMHPANVDVLTAAGVECAVLANNHVLDWGREGLLQTLATLRDAGVKVAGAGEDLSAATAPAILDTPQGRVLIFAMAHGSSGVPPEWAAGPDRPGVHLLPDLSPNTAGRIANEILQQGRNSGDMVVASIHWGGNWGYSIPSEQERFAKMLIDQGGVDIVHGHSSHHPKRIEIYQGRLILYGAGDLINDYEGIGGYDEFRPELSLLYLPKLSASGRLQSMLLVPLRMERFRLNRAAAEEAAWLRDRMARESRGVQLELTENQLIVAK